jgi:hypothetical protein
MSDPIDRAIEAADPLQRLRAFLADGNHRVKLECFEGRYWVAITTSAGEPVIDDVPRGGVLTDAIQSALDDAGAP